MLTELVLASRRFLTAAACSWIAVWALSAAMADESEVGTRGESVDAAEELFVRRVLPLLTEKCSACHAPAADEAEGGLALATREGLLVGGESGEPAVAPGDPDSSPLWLAVAGGKEGWSVMPPKQSEWLSDEQAGWIRQWILGGAPWPSEERMQQIAANQADQWSAEDGVSVPTSGGLSEQWTRRRYPPESLWAYRPVVKPDLAASGSEPIDRLIELRMPEGLLPADPAERPVLIRRAAFDLTGLPPTPEQVEAFLADPAPDHEAFAKVVDQLLESPHYGERMAQHWLDVARYADSSGFANDFERGNAWRYRDYVIRSFQNDKPYDQFILEQIAGDELHTGDPEKVVATGFLRMGPWELTGMEVPRVARMRFLDDVTNSVGETFLAQSLQCARCHDHKFDPIPTHDYYAIQAVFATTQLSEREAPFLPEENTDGFDEKRYLEARREDHLANLRRLDKQLLAAAEAWFIERSLDPAAWEAAVAQVQKSGGGRGNVFNAARGVMLRNGVPEDKFPPKSVGFTPQDYGAERVARKGLERLNWEMDRYRPFALAVHSGLTPRVNSVYAPVRVPKNRLTDGELEESCILVGGDPFAKGEPVEPGVLSVVENGRPFPITDQIEGRRTELARWITRSDNPLTTRTIVNRVWLWHFGRPIAGNPNNFGSTGKPPTHPELLDWLAATLVENEWSIKSLHRTIMNSEAYRRGAVHPQPELLTEVDPEGKSYAVFLPRRLSAEELRDAMLFASGELNPTVGGIPNRPEINLEAAMQPRQVMGTFAAAWVPNPLPEQRHRRSIYTLKLRGLADPMLEVFNTPSPDFSCEMRESSTVTPQVFTLMNSRNVHGRALALAHRVAAETDEDEVAVNRCFELTLGRRPRAEEMEMCLEHWQQTHSFQESPSPRFQPPEAVRREAVEENTGERFSFVEHLHAYREFVPDLQHADVDARTRALAEVCLVLLNTNEFAYVY